MALDLSVFIKYTVSIRVRSFPKVRSAPDNIRDPNIVLQKGLTLTGISGFRKRKRLFYFSVKAGVPHEKDRICITS